MKQKLPFIATVIITAGVFLAVVLVCLNMFGSTMQTVVNNLSSVAGGSQSSGGLTIDPNAKTITNSYYFGGGSSGSIAIPGYERLLMKAGQTEQEVLLFNPENNKCFFVIELFNDDGTLLFKSGLIEPGKALYSITLSEALKAGSYGAVLRYSCYSEGTLDKLNGAEAKLILEVT